jgi:hypothetical protein
MRESGGHPQVIRTRLQPIQFPHEIRCVSLGPTPVQLEFQKFQLTV